jgi:hypothetical protein
LEGSGKGYSEISRIKIVGKEFESETIKEIVGSKRILSP